MVSAVHLVAHCRDILSNWASKGLHMVSAVHQSRGVRVKRVVIASKGLHMVSAVHHKRKPPADQVECFKGAAHG